MGIRRGAPPEIIFDQAAVGPHGADTAEIKGPQGRVKVKRGTVWLEISVGLLAPGAVIMGPDYAAPLRWVYCKSGKCWAPLGLLPTARVFDTRSVTNRAAALPVAPHKR